MSRPVSLPMYEVPAAPLAAFWAGLRGHLRDVGIADVPDGLTAPKDLSAHWCDPELLLSQTCGYPLTRHLVGKVLLVGTPCYAAEGCDGPFYSSLLMVRAVDPAESIADLRGRRAAFNERGSQSGWNALRALVAPLARSGRFFGSTVETGAHEQSLLLVQTGAADVAAVDCVTYALLGRHSPERLRGLRAIGRTAAGVPSLPFVTSMRTSAPDLERLRRALTAACADPILAASRAALLIDGFEVLSLDDYAACTRMEDEALAWFYPELA